MQKKFEIIYQETKKESGKKITVTALYSDSLKIIALETTENEETTKSLTTPEGFTRAEIIRETIKIFDQEIRRIQNAAHASVTPKTGKRFSAQNNTELGLLSNQSALL